MKAIFILCLVVGCATISAWAASTDDDEGWSEPVKGLRARIIVSPPVGVPGRQILDVYLELKHSTNLGAALSFHFSYWDTLRFKLFDETGKEVPQGGDIDTDGGLPNGFPACIPVGGTLRVPVKWHGHSGSVIPVLDSQPKRTFSSSRIEPVVNRGAVELNFVSDYWAIDPSDSKKYFLVGILHVPAPPLPAPVKGIATPISLEMKWSGTITTKKTLVPTLPSASNKRP